jgi:predicted aminopeptidase
LRVFTAIALTGLLFLQGCSTLGYLSQTASGHLGLISSARAIEDVIGDPATSRELKDRLQLAREIRQYASLALGLPENRSYARYTSLDRPFAVWNVVATREFSVHPLRSCFPFSGCTDYRGFFDLAAANHYAELLRARGHDVLVYGVPAYSTLGYFDDPLLSSFIYFPEPELARLLFHELAHQRVYVKDDSAFNESFAIVVEREGVRRWLAARGRPEMLAGSNDALGRTTDFNELLLRTRGRLEELYQSSNTSEDVVYIRQRKARILSELKAGYEALRQKWGGRPSGYDRLVGEHPNNALLALAHTYGRWVPAFERMLEESEGELPRFYGSVKSLAEQPAEARDAVLMRLMR